MNQLLKPELNAFEKSHAVVKIKNTTNFQQESLNKSSKYKIQSKIFNKTKPFNKNRFFMFQFLISSLVACFFLVIFFIRLFDIQKGKIASHELMKTYQISTLYSNNSDYSASRITNNGNGQNVTPYSIDDPFVIGMIKIDKIGLNYPILSYTSRDLLNISVCRFAGPMPNMPGNLCIAGHNYVDYKLFSRLHELELKDTIKLYNLNGQMIKYTIVKKYEVKANDMSCTAQNTDGNILLTLLTCNNVSGKRLILVAKPIV